MRLKQSLLILLIAFVPGMVNALGLGKIQPESALNEPFEARINLLSATVEELDSLKVILADEAAFKRAGIPRSSVLRELQFVVKESDTGPDYIHVYSNDPIREPFLNFLLEVSWSKGRLYREYTVLLDPPIYAGTKIKKKLSQPATAPETSTTGNIVREIEDNKVVYNPEYKPSRRSTAGPPASRSTPPASSPQINYGGGDYGPVVSGDTLWSIAKAMRPDNSVSVQQMMLALLRANPEAFINNNINGLKRGHVLNMPDMSDIQSVDKVNAFSQAKMQNELWQEARGAMATAVTPRPESAAEQPEEPTAPTEEAATTEPEPTPAEPESEPELRLVAPADKGEVAGEGGKQTNEALTQELALANETLEALKLENTELKDKLSETEVIVDDLKRLIVLKEDELAALQQKIADQQAQKAAAPAEEMGTEEAQQEEPQAEEAMTETPPAAEEETTPVEEAEKPAQEATEEPSGEMPAKQKKPKTASTTFIPPAVMGLISQFKNNLPYSAVIPGGILLLFLIVMQLVQRRRSASAIEIPQSAFPEFEDVDATAEPAEDATDINPALADADAEAETILPGSEEEAETPEFEEDKTRIVAPPATGAAEEVEPDAFDITPQEEEEDPLAEVNVFLAYEHFDQAEEFVKKAIEKDPDNLEFHTKLLEVYYAANNKKGYEEEARNLYDMVNGQGDYWNMAVAMWQEISPNRTLFDEPTPEEAEEEATSASGGGIVNITGEEGESAGLDFDLDTTAGTDDIMDVTGTEEPDVLDVTAAVDMGEEDEELDVTAGTEAIEEALDIPAPENEDNSLDFDIGSEAPAEEETPAAEEDVLDISLDTGEGAVSEETISEGTVSEEAESNEEEVLDITAAADEEDNSLDMAFDMEAPASEEAAASDEEVLDLSFDSGEETAEDNALDMDISLDVPEVEKSEEPEEDTGTDEGSLDFAMDMEVPKEEEAAEDLTEKSASGSDLLDVTSAFMEDDSDASQEAEQKPDDDDLLNVSATGKTGEDLLDVTSSSNFDLDNSEDLLDVTTSASSAGMDADELVAGDDSSQEDKNEGLESDKEDKETATASIESDGLDFELSPDDDSGDVGKESSFNGIDITSGSGATVSPDMDFNIESDNEDDSLEFDMDSTMQIPSKRLNEELEKEQTDAQEVKEPAADTNFDLVLDEEDDDADHTIMVPRSDSSEQSADDEIATQLDLAKAYVELGDKDNARTILDEIIAIGNEEQKQQAQELLSQI